MTVIDLSKHRAPTHYTIRITHHWDGRLEVFIEDLDETDRSREVATWALHEAAKMFPLDNVIREGDKRV